MRLLEESLSLHSSVLTTSGLGPSAIWWPVTLLVYSSSVILSHYGLTQLTLWPQQIGWDCVLAFPVSPTSPVGIYSQTNFFRMTHMAILACQKQSYVAAAKTSRSTHTVTVLRWPKFQPAVFQQVKPAVGDVVGNCSLYKFLPEDTPQRVF